MVLTPSELLSAHHVADSMRACLRAPVSVDMKKDRREYETPRDVLCWSHESRLSHVALHPRMECNKRKGEESYITVGFSWGFKARVSRLIWRSFSRWGAYAGYGNVPPSYISNLILTSVQIPIEPRNKTSGTAWTITTTTMTQHPPSQHPIHWTSKTSFLTYLPEMLGIACVVRKHIKHMKIQICPSAQWDCQPGTSIIHKSRWSNGNSVDHNPFSKIF